MKLRGILRKHSQKNARLGTVVVSAILATYISVSLAQDTSKARELHREGIRIEKQLTEFRAENDNLQMVQGEVSFQVLQNLAAQRIYRANRDDPNDAHWTVTGRFTEFEGRNYFLIETATRGHAGKPTR
jgi:hypothetical protein